MRILGKRVLARIIKTNIKIGSLYTPEQRRTLEAEIIEVGDEMKHVNSGDRIIYDKFAGICIDKNDPDLIILTEDQVWAKIEN